MSPLFSTGLGCLISALPCFNQLPLLPRSCCRCVANASATLDQTPCMWCLWNAQGARRVGLRALQLSGNGLPRVSFLQRSHLRVLDKDLPIKKLPNSRDQEGMKVIFFMSLECPNLVLKHKEDALHRLGMSLKWSSTMVASLLKNPSVKCPKTELYM